MEKLFVVSKVGFEYNDEIYHQTECTALNPVMAYHSKEAANAEAMRLNIAELRKVELYEYGYGVDEMFSYRDRDSRYTVVQILSKYDDACDDDLESFDAAIKAASDEDLTQVVGLLRMKFFEVTEINVVD